MTWASRVWLAVRSVEVENCVVPFRGSVITLVIVKPDLKLFNGVFFRCLLKSTSDCCQPRGVEVHDSELWPKYRQAAGDVRLESRTGLWSRAKMVLKKLFGPQAVVAADETMGKELPLRQTMTADRQDMLSRPCCCP